MSLYIIIYLFTVGISNVLPIFLKIKCRAMKYGSCYPFFISYKFPTLERMIIP